MKLNLKKFKKRLPCLAAGGKANQAALPYDMGGVHH